MLVHATTAQPRPAGLIVWLCPICLWSQDSLEKYILARDA